MGLLNRYSDFLNGHPGLVLLVSTLISCGLTGLGVVYRSFDGFTDPQLGFEVRGTDISRRVLAWGKLRKSMGREPTDSKRFGIQSPKPIKKRGKRETQEGEKNYLALFFDALSTSPCPQFERKVPSQYLSQVIFEAKSTADLFSPGTMAELCRLQLKLNKTMQMFYEHSPYRHFWSLPNYVACMSDALNCTHLTANDLRTSYNTLKGCARYRTEIWECAKERNKVSLDEVDSAEHSDYDSSSEGHTVCSSIPLNCRSKHITDLYHIILPKPMIDSNFDLNFGPVHMNFLLPAFTYDTYFEFGRHNVSLGMYSILQEKLHELSHYELNHLVLRGMKLGIKFDLFDVNLGKDTIWGMLALLVVTCIIWGYSGSLLYTTAVGLCLILSVGVAYCVYRLVFQLTFFPFMNLLVVVLLVGIGADDTFVLRYLFKKAKADQKRLYEPAEKNKEGHRIRSLCNNQVSAIYTNGDVKNADNMDQFWRKITVSRMRHVDVSAATLRTALSHAAISMLVTSLTTAAAFYANAISDVIVIRLFGIFAGTTVLVNYVLVITFLPSCLLLIHRYVNPAFDRSCLFCKLSKMLNILRYLRKQCATLPKYILAKPFPLIISKFRYVWIIIFTSTTIASVVLILYKPGLKLPDKNPLQVFKDSHPFEWYDNHAIDLFGFARASYNYPIYISIIWGVHKAQNVNYLNPLDMGTLEINTEFNMSSLQSIIYMNDLCKSLKSLEFVETSTASVCWTQRFLDWSHTRLCRRNAYICCNVTSPWFKDEYMNACLAHASRSLHSDWSNSPLFSNSSEHVIGYSLTLQTQYLYSDLYTDLHSIFTAIEKQLTPMLSMGEGTSVSDAWYSTSYGPMLTWYDLLDSLLHSTPISVLVSVSVAFCVAVLTTRGAIVISILSMLTIAGVILTTVASLVLLRWKINVVESTIIILTVGLSFDFTLHYAVAYQLAPPTTTRLERVYHCLDFIGMPVLLSAITTFTAGLAMIPSTTNAYFQIGVFMILVTTISYFYSTVYFLSLLGAWGPLPSTFPTFSEKLWFNIKMCCDNLLMRKNSEPSSANNTPEEHWNIPSPVLSKTNEDKLVIKEQNNNRQTIVESKPGLHSDTSANNITVLDTETTFKNLYLTPYILE